MFPALQSLRFLFALMIFMSHFSFRGIAAFPAGGDCGVAFFFILSGFLLTHRYEAGIKGGTFRCLPFLRRRLIKIWPLHLLCLALWIMVTHEAIDRRLAFNALLLQSWIPDMHYFYSYNSVSWFLSTILFCYISFPLLCRHASYALLALVLTACAAAYWLVPYEQICALLYVQPLVRLVDFFLGIMLHRLYVRLRNAPTPPFIECMLFVMLAAILVAYPHLDAKLRNAPIFWAVLLPLIFFHTKANTPATRLLSHPVLQWLGSLSLPFFMFHQLVISILKHRFGFLPAEAMLILCLAATIIVSWTTHRFFLLPISSKQPTQPSE